jgi:Domain of unknown function (DUF929)
MARSSKPTPPVSQRTALVAVSGVVMLLLVVVVGALAFRGSSSKPSKATPPATDLRDQSLAPASLMNAIVGVPASTLVTVGKGSASPPEPITGGADVRADGKPLVFYDGAEFCPYCAAERWAMINALGRFGTFKGIRIAYSSASDVFAGTPTLSFHGASYTSKYITFQSVEEETETGVTLEQESQKQAVLLAQFDAPPYGPKGGSIPFVLIGGHAVVVGTQYAPDPLQGLTHVQIAKALSDPKSGVAKGAIGAANLLTADICAVTGNQPASACPAAITSLRS